MGPTKEGTIIVVVENPIEKGMKQESEEPLHTGQVAFEMTVEDVANHIVAEQASMVVKEDTNYIIEHNYQAGDGADNGITITQEGVIVETDLNNDTVVIEPDVKETPKRGRKRKADTENQDEEGEIRLDDEDEIEIRGEDGQVIKRKPGISLTELQKTMTDWDSINTFEDLKAAKVRAVASRLAPARSYSLGGKQLHVITGQDLIDRVQEPECLSAHILGDFMSLGKGREGRQSRDKLAKLRSLVPRDSTSKPVLSAFTLLTNDDVTYQCTSLQELAVRLIDHEKVMTEVWSNLSGQEVTKIAKIDGAREVVRLVLDQLHETQLDKATHGGMLLLETVWNIIGSLLPDKDPNAADDPSAT